MARKSANDNQADQRIFLSYSRVDRARVNGLGNLLFAEPGLIAKAEGRDEVEFKKLIYSSTESGTASAAMFKFMGPSDMAKQLKVDKDEHVIAAQVSGTFKL